MTGTRDRRDVLLHIAESAAAVGTVAIPSQARSESKGHMKRQFEAESVLAIQKLVIQYSHRARAKDVDGLVALFAPGGGIVIPDNAATAPGDTQLGQIYSEFGPGKLMTGADLRHLIERGVTDLNPWPQTFDHLIDLQGETSGTGRVFVEFREGTKAYAVTAIGAYDDRYIAVEGAWKFLSRQPSVTHIFA